MELQYRNTREDLTAFYSSLWSDGKASQRNEYYQSALWHLAVLGLAIYVAAKHDEIFVVCVFVTLGGFYIMQNWSFSRRWSAQLRAYASAVPETTNSLALDDGGAVERFSGVELRVPWSEIQDYTSHDGMLFIHFLKSRAFVVPLCQLSVSQCEELIEMLEKHSVRKRELTNRHR